MTVGKIELKKRADGGNLILDEDIKTIEEGIVLVYMSESIGRICQSKSGVKKAIE